MFWQNLIPILGTSLPALEETAGEFDDEMEEEKELLSPLGSTPGHAGFPFEVPFEIHFCAISFVEGVIHEAQQRRVRPVPTHLSAPANATVFEVQVNPKASLGVRVSSDLLVRAADSPDLIRAGVRPNDRLVAVQGHAVATTEELGLALQEEWERGSPLVILTFQREVRSSACHEP